METGKQKYVPTNRDWINNMAKIDLLNMLNDNMPSGVCIMELLTSREDYECPKEFAAVCKNVGTGDYQIEKTANCYGCICKWLNEKH